MNHTPQNCRYPGCDHDERDHYDDRTKYSPDRDIVWGCRKCDNPVIELGRDKRKQ